MTIRTASRAAVWASTWAWAFLALHVYWAFGGRFGFGDQTDPIPATTSTVTGWVWTLGVLVMFAAGPVVPLALVRPWGRRLPRRLLLVLMWIGAAVLLIRGGLGLLDGLLRVLGVAGGLTRLSYEETLGSAHPTAYTLWSSTAIDVVFVVGGVLFARAAALSHRGER